MLERGKGEKKKRYGKGKWRRCSCMCMMGHEQRGGDPWTWTDGLM